MKGLICFALFAAIHSLALAASWETPSFRTERGGLVRVGMPAEAARQELGQVLHRGQRARTGKKTEIWTYRGRDGDYRITMVRGQVAKIVVTPRRD